MENIKDILHDVIGDLVAKKEGRGKDPVQAWLKKILTRRELEHIKFNYFKKGVLGIWVDSSTWLYALNLKKTDLLGKLRNVSSGIKDIRFRIGETK
ncbi:MAG: DciA family protein [Candidatus Omnitrophota bacterium]